MGDDENFVYEKKHVLEMKGIDGNVGPVYAFGKTLERGGKGNYMIQVAFLMKQEVGISGVGLFFSLLA